MFYTVEDLLLVSSLTTIVILVFFAILLARKGLFRWTTAGFWSWNAFALYFILNPLASIRWNIELYRTYVYLSGGLSRGEWIWLVATAGIIVFFLVYLITSTRPVTWNLPAGHLELSLGLKAVMIGFVIISILSLLAYRTGVISTGDSLQIEGGRFTGTTTGYEYIAHVFIFVPVVLLLLSRSRFQQLVGMILGLGYTLLSFPHAWIRFTIVSMLLAMSLASTVYRARKWPPPAYFLLIFLVTAALVLRGHSTMSSGQEFSNIVLQIPNRIGSILASGDSAMLASWYLESYVRDQITGFDYGIPLINYLFFGFIPGRIFPDKYFLLDWLRSNQPLVHPTILAHLYGAKSSLIGSFYSNGGIIAVLLLMGIMGWLCRRIDGMLSPESSPLVKATGISWIASLWMIWGSHDYWGVMTMGILVLPAIVVWFFSRKKRDPYDPY